MPLLVMSYSGTIATFLFIVPEPLVVIQQCELPEFDGLHSIMTI